MKGDGGNSLVALLSGLVGLLPRLPPWLAPAWPWRAAPTNWALSCPYYSPAQSGTGFFHTLALIMSIVALVLGRAFLYAGRARVFELLRAACPPD